MSERLQKNYNDFVEIAENDVNLPLFIKIGRRYKQLMIFIYSLSFLSLMAGFMFFYNPLHNISDSYLLAFVISFIILVIIEFLSLISYELAILEIYRNKSAFGGWSLLLFAMAILAFNFYSHAEGNKALVKKLAVKPVKMENNLDSIITIIDFDYQTKFDNLKNDYLNANYSINQEYSSKIESLEADIKSAFAEDGTLLDWRKNNEAVKNKALLLQNWEAKKTELAVKEANELKRLNQYTDSIKSRIYTKQTSEIKNVTQQADNTGQIAYLMSFILGFLILSVRTIAVFAKIATENDEQDRDERQFIIIKTIHPRVNDTVQRYRQKRKELKNGKNKKSDNEKQKSNSNPEFIISNPEVLEDAKKQLKMTGNGNGNGNSLKEY